MTTLPLVCPVHLVLYPYNLRMGHGIWCSYSLIDMSPVFLCTFLDEKFPKIHVCSFNVYHV